MPPTPAPGITPPEPDRTGRLDLLAEAAIARVLDRVGEECGIIGLGGHLNGVVHRFVAENIPAGVLTPEGIAERMGILKPRPNPAKRGKH